MMGLAVLLGLGSQGLGLPGEPAAPRSQDVAPIGSHEAAQRLIFEDCVKCYRAAKDARAASDLGPSATIQGRGVTPALGVVGQAMDALAATGHAEAAEFSLNHFRELHGLLPAQDLSRELLVLREQLFRVLLQEPGGAHHRRALELLARERDLSAPAVEALLRSFIHAPSISPMGRARAELALARLLAPWSPTDSRGSTAPGSLQSRQRAEGLALYKSISEQFPGTPIGDRAESDVWRLKNLSLGAVAPDFLTHDVAGNEIRLSDFRGQVVVVHFTASNAGAARAALELSQDQQRRHWDARFAWLGIHRGGDRSQLLSALEEALPGGEHAWEAPESSRGAAQAWHAPEQETLIVLDSGGRVQAINPAGVALDGQVERLLSELQQQGRKRKEGLAP